MSINDDLWLRRSELVEADVDGELIGLHVDNGICYGFNATATRVWALLDKPSTLEQICRQLEAEFKISHDDCTDAVHTLLEELKSEGLVETTKPHRLQ